MLQDIWNTLFVNTFYSTEKEKTSSNYVDKQTIIVLFCVAISLVFIHYFGNLNFLIESLELIHLEKFAQSIFSLKSYFPNYRIFQLTYWVSVLAIFYFIVPLFIIRVILGKKLIKFGLPAKGILKDYKIYLLFFLFMLPFVILVSYSESFQHKYPFYNPAGESLWPNFVIWQCLYFFQFFILEFFFRGFMLHGIKKRFGFYSIWVMMIPYMMIHFQKPMPETIGAIFAGIILGTLSLKSRSIWLGVAIHYSVAITMDIAALWQKGYFT